MRACVLPGVDRGVRGASMYARGVDRGFVV